MKKLILAGLMVWPLLCRAAEKEDKESFYVRDYEEAYGYLPPITSKVVLVYEEPQCPQDDDPCTEDHWDGWECMRVWNITCENQRR